MKFPKLFLALPILFSVVGCGGSKGHAGVYSFQLGAKEGTHIAIHLTLTDEPYAIADETIKQYNPKKFKLDFDINGINSDDIINTSMLTSESINDSQLSSEQSQESLSEVSSELTSEDTDEEGDEEPWFPSDFSLISGYYYTAKEFDKNGEVLHLGIDLLNTFTIDAKVTEKIIYATVSGDTVNVVIPVSLNDLYYQLYWYGFRVGNVFELLDPVNLYEEDKSFFELALKGNNPGTHPTKEVITAIQDYQKERKEKKPAGYKDTEELFVNYRDFHTLNMGLLKNG